MSILTLTSVLFIALLISPSSANLSQSDINVIVSLHNRERSLVRVNPVSWSSSVAASAQNWSNRQAAQCNMYHSSGSGYGENLSSGSGSALSSLVELWVNEKHSTRSGQYNHYTQMVWGSSTQVGCGVARGCGKTYLTCSYYPAGNVIGQSPYQRPSGQNPPPPPPPYRKSPPKAAKPAPAPTPKTSPTEVTATPAVPSATPVNGTESIYSSSTASGADAVPTETPTSPIDHHDPNCTTAPAAPAPTYAGAPENGKSLSNSEDVSGSVSIRPEIAVLVALLAPIAML
ncbi:CAP domain-containing protein [Paraphysoderma sedebokerense]|nr:CAP domain-containing protein [Paraphysoderma sedebokerense]